MKNNLKKIIPSLIAIFLGVISSGLWELLFSPIIKSLSSIPITLSSKISVSFADWYASAIASADREFLMIELRAWITFIVIVLFIINTKSLKRFVSTIPWFIKLFIIIFLFADLGIDIQISNTAHFTLQNIEIIAPYISDQEYKILKSDFYSMQNIDDFNNLTERIESTAFEYDLPLN